MSRHAPEDAEEIWRREALATLRSELAARRIEVRQLRQRTDGVLSATTVNRALRVGTGSATRRTIWVLVDALGLSHHEFRTAVQERVVDEITRELAGGPVQDFPTVRVAVDTLARSTDPDLVVFARLLRTRVSRPGGSDGTDVLVTAEMIGSLAAFTHRTPWECWQAVAREGAAADSRPASWEGAGAARS